jgi:hypothetical protein
VYQISCTWGGFCPEMEVSTTEKKKGFGNMSE